jgi:plastocyanin
VNWLSISVLPLAIASVSSAAEWSLASTGRVTGRVSVTGEVHGPKPLKVFKNREFCGPAVPNETLLTSREGGLRNVIVILRPLERVATMERERIVLDNKNCAFVPHVQVAAVGSDLVLKNSDPILHAVHARIDKETLFNVGLPRWREVSKTLDRAGVIRISCDVLHTWMTAVIIVTSSPYYSMTDETGRFTIDGLPAGGYTVEIFHEKLGTKSTPIYVTDGTTLSLDVVYRLGR